MKVRPYPWQTLEAVPREAVLLLRDVRRAVRRAMAEDKIAEALSDLLGERVVIAVSLVEITARKTAATHGVSVVMATSDESLRVELELDRNLARALVARIIGRPAKLADPQASVDPEIEGAVAAIASRIAQRAHGPSETLVPIGPGSLRTLVGERRIEVHASLTIGADAYRVRAGVLLQKPFVQETELSSVRLASLGALPIALPVVVATSTAAAHELYALGAGDIWMPGGGWTIGRAARTSDEARPASLTGTVMLVAPASERAIAAKLGESGEIVVVGVEVTPLDVETTMANTNPADDTATSEVILEAPLVVRVELGAVTLTAREWAALGPGDIIALGRRVSEPVILRVAGVEVGRGELVDIEGELGVRLRERVKST